MNWTLSAQRQAATMRPTSLTARLEKRRRTALRLRSVLPLAATVPLAFLIGSGVGNAQTAVTVKIDAKANNHPISPLIYGVCLANSTTLADLNATLNRNGGNNTTRYNWQLNADNRASDWFFESIGYPSATAGEVGDTFITNSKGGGAQAMLTIPTIGWVANLGTNRSILYSFSVNKYGAQQSTDPYLPDAGNGVSASTGKNITGNNPNDASVLKDSTYQQSWAQHLVNTWGLASNGGLQYYILDNEPSIWHATHRDVHPTGATMAEIRDKILDYGAKIKSVDSSALVVGPEEWGWSGYFYSGYDQQYGSINGWSYLPDRTNNGGWDYLPWVLDQLHKDEISTGVRKLDVFSVHYYPQGAYNPWRNEFSDMVDTGTQLLRNQSTRSLWDPNYLDQSWINDYVQLIPRIKNWVTTYYPGLKTAITEYNWGAEGHINGATTQADIYGIFGREGLDMATRWTAPDSSTPTYKAMKLYRNYDGKKSTFGDTSVSAAVPNPDNLSAFAAVRSTDGALTVMVINKVLPVSPPVNTTVTLSLANFAAGSSAQAWQLTSSNAITQLANVNVANGALVATVPAQSITLFIIPAATASSTATFVGTDTKTQGSWKGVYGKDGYSVIGNSATYPNYATVGANGNSSWTWAASTSDVRGLQKAASSTDRIASCLYAASSFTLDINLTDGATHQVSLYCLDWDTTARQQSVQIQDAATGTVLDTESLTSFHNGTYLVWNLKGHVKAVFTRTGGANTVNSGIFFN